MLALLATLFACVAAASASTYVGAVSQHESVAGATTAPGDVLKANLALFEQDVTTAAESGAQIIVFPEWGLWPLEYTDSRAKIQPLCSSARELGVYMSTLRAPCLDGANSTLPTLPTLSCAAQRNKIDIVFNTCDVQTCAEAGSGYKCRGDGDDLIIRNINVAMRADGTIHNVYAKSHVYLSKTFDEPIEPDHVIFESSFGIKFGMFVCFDILFSDPGPYLHKNLGIDHFVYSSQIPLVGRATFKTWSFVHNSALLASNYGTKTSGIYRHGSRLSNGGSDRVLVATIEA